MLFKRIVVLWLFCTATIASFAQCGCTFTIEAGAGGVSFDGAARGVKPGDVICLQGGARERIIFTNIRGSAGNPVIIKNCGGQTLLGGPNANTGMIITGSRYFRITGTGQPGIEYGIKITETRSGSSGILVSGLSSDVEIDHVEITKTGFAGIMAKTDPSNDCSNTSMVRPNFTMYNVTLHHNYVHHIGGEGFYVGNSFYTGTTVYCGSTQYPHEIRGVKIFDNLFDGCGWESIQVGSAVQDVDVHHNRIYNYGTADVSTQNGGIQFGLGTSGRLHDNFIKGNPNGTGGQAIVIQGIGNNYVYNNVIVNSPDEAITVNVRPTPLSTDIVNRGWLGGTYVINNTIVNPGKAAIADFINEAPGNVFYNNLIVTGPDPNWNKTKGNYDWKITNNVVVNSVAAAGFVNPGIDDYNLRSNSPAVNVGRDVASYGVVSDYQGRGRPSGPAWDAGAFELSGNQKPTVNVGANQSITLPTNSGTVVGAASDPDGSIISYQWSKVSGPNATLTNGNTSTLLVSNMVEGVYVFSLTVTDNAGETASAQMTFTVLPAAINSPPVANAGSDRTLTLPLNTAALNGTGTDTDGTITGYNWEKVSGPNATLEGSNTASLVLKELVEGTYVFRLTVTDDDGSTDNAEITVVVNAAPLNQVPVVNAGADKSLTLPTNSVNLEGTASDPDGSIKTYLWTKRSGGAATLTNINSPTLQLSDLAQGNYVFRLSVTDDKDAGAFDEISVTVDAANQAPQANAGGDQIIKLPTNTTTLNGSGSDADGSITVFNWTKISGPDVTLVNANNATLTLDDLVQGVYVFRLTVTDNENATGFDEVTVTVNAANLPPVANAGSNKNLTLPANAVLLNGSGSDADGTITAWLWEKVNGPAATMNNSTTPNLSLTNLVQGTYTFRLTVTDNDNAKASATVRVVVFPAVINQAPSVNAGPNVTLTLPTNSVTLNGTATDPDGTVASILWEKLNGPDATLGNTTVASLSLSNLLEGTYVFRLTATDDKGASSSDEVTVSVTAINQPPRVNAGTDALITLPTDFLVLSGSASDPDGSIASYHWEKRSGGLATMGPDDQSSLNVSGLASGTYVFRLTVTDNDGATAFDEMKVTVQTPSNVNPLVNAGRDVSITLPTNSVNLAGSATDSDGTISSFQWSQVSGGVSSLINANTRTLTARNLEAGTYVFRLTATDNAGGASFDDVRVIVRPAAVNALPVANAGPDIALTLPNNSTNLIGSGADPNGTITAYAWAKVSGPAVELSNANTPVLSLRNLREGLYVFQLQVTDNAGAKDTDFATVTVFPATVNQSPQLSVLRSMTVTLPTDVLTIEATASDGDGEIASYLWTKSSGPAVNVLGESSATLTLSELVEGSYIFRITVTDNEGAEAFADVQVTVLPAEANRPPVVTVENNRTLFLPVDQVILTGSASDTDGSISKYEWTKVSGPPVTLANATTPTLTGTNLQAGVYRFRLTATDNDGATGYSEVTITVFPGVVNQPPIANAGVNQTIVAPNNTTSFNGSGYDTDGSIVSYLWTQKSGPPSTLENATSPTLLVNDLVAGTFVYELTVTDDDGATGSSSVQLIVAPEGINQLPIADAGFDRLIALPENSLDIQGSGTDHDGTIVSYAWVKKTGPSAVLGNAQTARLQLSGLEIGVYVFTLTVTDNRGGKNSDEVKVTVTPGTFNQNPVVDAGSPVSIRLPINTVTLSAVASDPDGTVASYLWTQQSGPATEISPDNTAAINLTLPAAGTYLFEVSVTDDKGATGSDEVIVTVLEGGTNAPPIVSASPGGTIVLPTNEITLTGTASDSDGRIAKVEWTQQSGPTGITMTGDNTTSLSLSGLELGEYTFRLTATDNENASAYAETSFTVTNSVATPVVYAGRDTTLVLPNDVLILSGEVVSAQANIVNYAWTQIDGDPVTMAGEYPLVSIVDLLPGSYTFRFTVTDRYGNSASDDVRVQVSEDQNNPLGAALFFSPNRDYYNESWEIQNLRLIENCPVNIFNSMGQKVFSADQYENNWTGQYNGEVLRGGDYYYVIECSEKTYAGAVRLIR